MALVAGIVTVSILGSVISTARAESASITSWTGTVFSGFDPYYQTSVRAYTAGSNVSMYATVSGPFFFFGGPPPPPINVTSVKVKMDWGTNYTSAGPYPQIISQGGTYTFKITFAAPSTTVATNLFAHNGQIIVKFSTSGGPSTEQTSSACRFISPFDSGCFVVYSTDQVDDINLMKRFGVAGAFGLSVVPCVGFTAPQASSLCGQATKELVAGTNLYATGDFAGAKPHLQNASNLADQALTAESNASSITLATTVGGWGLLLLGISSIVGVILYALRRGRPRPMPTQAPASSTTPS